MSHFKKCTGESKVKLDPGQMKDIRLNFKFDGSMTRDLRACYCTVARKQLAQECHLGLDALPLNVRSTQLSLQQSSHNPLHF